MDLSKLTKSREEKEQQKRIDSNMELAKELYSSLKVKNLQVQDASLVIKFLNDMIQSKAGKKIQEMYLNHLD